MIVAICYLSLVATVVMALRIHARNVREEWAGNFHRKLRDRITYNINNARWVSSSLMVEGIYFPPWSELSYSIVQKGLDGPRRYQWFDTERIYSGINSRAGFTPNVHHRIFGKIQRMLWDRKR